MRLFGVREIEGGALSNPNSVLSITLPNLFPSVSTSMLTTVYTRSITMFFSYFMIMFVCFLFVTVVVA